MKLPSGLDQIILESIGLPSLTKDNCATYRKIMNEIRKQMYQISVDFAQSKPTEDTYADAYFIYNFPMNVMKRYFLCTPDGRIELVRLNKSTSTANVALDSVQKDDIISIDNVIQSKPHYWQVRRHTHIKIMYKTTH